MDGSNSSNQAPNWIATLTPSEFEQQVEAWLKLSGVGLREFQVQRLETLTGTDGEYEIDVTARFEALGVNFLVLVECKHHKHPIKRDVVQVLFDRIRAVGAHKGIIFATTTFQRGAVEYAKAHGIALVEVADGRTSYFTKSDTPLLELPPWVPKYVAWVRYLTTEGHEGYHQITENEPATILERMSVQTPE